MTWDIRRIVTGHDANGKVGIVSDEQIKPVTIGLVPGAAFQLIWGMNETPVVGTKEKESTFTPYCPGPGGTRIVLFQCPPDSTGGTPQGDVAELMAEADRLLPGAMSAMAPDEEGMHKTDTVDFILVLEGEMWLTAEGAPETLMTAGTCVVLQGTRHAWHNRSDKPVYMLCAFTGAERVTEA